MTQHWVPDPQVGRIMSDPLIQLGISWRSHEHSHCQRLPDSFSNQGKKHYPTFVENIKLMQTEKSYSILSFNWKEENLLKKKLNFLESMKKYEASAWLMEQKAFYKRCYLKFQRSELAHARLLGHKELVKWLTSKGSFSTYSTTLVDDSEAAVKTIVEKRAEKERNKMLFNLHKNTPYPAVRRGVLKDFQAISTPNLKTSTKEEGRSTPLKIRRLPLKVETKPALVLSQESPLSPKQGAEHTKKHPEDRTPEPQEEHGAMDSSSMHPSIRQSHLQDAATGRESKGKLLRYIVQGDVRVEHPKKKRLSPRNNLHSLEYVPAGPASLNPNHSILRQVTHERNSSVSGRDNQRSPTAHPFSRLPFQQLLGERREAALQAHKIRTHSAGRRQETVFKENGKQTERISIITKDRNFLF